LLVEQAMAVDELDEIATDVQYIDGELLEFQVIP
jgi:hypothetical protein